MAGRGLGGGLGVISEEDEEDEVSGSPPGGEYLSVSGSQKRGGGSDPWARKEEDRWRSPPSFLNTPPDFLSSEVGLSSIATLSSCGRPHQSLAM